VIVKFGIGLVFGELLLIIVLEGLSDSGNSDLISLKFNPFVLHSFGKTNLGNKGSNFGLNLCLGSGNIKLEGISVLILRGSIVSITLTFFSKLNNFPLKDFELNVFINIKTL